MEAGPGQTRSYNEVTLVSVGGVDVDTLAAWPPNMKKYRQCPKFNRTKVEAPRDTGARTTMVMAKLVSTDQIIPALVQQAINADTETKFHPMPMVNFEWGSDEGLLA